MTLTSFTVDLLKDHVNYCSTYILSLIITVYVGGSQWYSASSLIVGIGAKVTNLFSQPLKVSPLLFVSKHLHKS